MDNERLARTRRAYPEDLDTSISLRFIQQWTPMSDVPSIVERVLYSCPVLGHTFQHNADDEYCGICGVPRGLAKTNA